MRTILAFSALVAIFGCNGPTIDGNGIMKTEQRVIGEFHSVALYGVGSMQLERGEKHPLKVKAEENLQKFINSKVDDGVMRVGVGNGSFQWHGFPEYETTYRELKSIDLKGQTNLVASEISEKQLKVTLEGQSGVALQGKTKSLHLTMTGHCSFTGSNFKVDQITIECTGQCKVLIDAPKELTVKADGQCVVEYVGKPEKLTVDAVGQSKVVQK